MQAKKPTYQQRKILQKNKLDTYKWYVQKEKSDEIQVVNVETKEVKTLSK